MSIKVCSFCNSQGEADRTYWQSEDGSACMCSECSLKYAKSTLDILNGDNSGASGAQQNSPELDELCEAIGDKLMETGYLTAALEDGDLAIVSINVESDESLFKININLVVDDRQSSELSPDEEENICDTFDSFLEQRDLKSSFAELGYDLDDNFDGYYAHLVE